MKKLFILYTLLTSIASFAAESVKPWIGIAIDTAPNGVLVKNAFANTPGFRAGLSAGDIILSIDDKKVSQPAELIKIVQTKGIGFKVNLKCLDAKGKNKEVTLELEAMPGMTELAEKNLLEKPAPLFKVTVLSKQKDKTKEFELAKNIGKVKIIEFWATWCGACMGAHPVIKEFSDKHFKEIDIISISNEELPLLKKFVKEAIDKKFISEKTYIVKGDETKLDKDYFVPAYPMFFVLDKKNIVRLIKIGAGSNLDEVFAKALELVKK